MPQSQLPDLNTIWLKWTDYCNNCLMHKDFEGAISAVYHLNAVFDQENRIEINTTKYKQLTTTRSMVKCPYCTNEIPRKDIKFFDLLLPIVEQVIRKSKTAKVWSCPDCHKNNRVDQTEFIQEVFSSPRYNSVIPEPPEPKNAVGVFGKRKFEADSKNWIRLALDEISHNLGIERRDYVPVMERVDVIDEHDV